MAYTFESTKAGYASMWAKAQIVNSKISAANLAAGRISSNADRYRTVEKATGVPWFFVGCIHMREADLNFKGCLANGEEIIGTGRKTTLVPKGLGPYATWEDSAIDALKHEGFLGISPWDAPRCLWGAEVYNGLGYVNRGVNSPYVWSWTNLQQSGKFTADGKFDSAAWDTQPGVAALMMALAHNLSDVAAALDGKPSGTPQTGPKPAMDATTTTTAGSNVFDQINADLQLAQAELPQLLSVLSIFFPPLKAAIPFLSLIPVVIQAVQTVQAATGGTPASATAAVVQHLTPGQPNAPALT
ncbi:MAG TPA: hypothetical protein VKD24_03500 [Candidatus Angelobacter sp.]|nr:hypothetical protein [Candidatus Angelobacter sp.]